MEPKEKALSLLDKMEKQTYSYQEYAGANESIAEIGYEAGKKCALIAINEIISELKTITCCGENDIEDAIQWYGEVKQELKKL
jgi:hypothetical protein